MSACNTLVWLISYESCGERISTVHTHNAIADYRDIDPNATVKRIDCAAVSKLIEEAEVFDAKYWAAPDGPLGVGLVNGDFYRLRDALQRVTGGV